VHIASISFSLIHGSSQKHNLTLMFDVVSNKISIQVNASLEMKRVCYCTADAKNLLVATGPCVLCRSLQGSMKWIQAQNIRYCLKC
jgi:hypothetical protein